MKRRKFLYIVKPVILISLIAVVALLPQAVPLYADTANLPILIAHRGQARHAPENTLPAFAACVELGIGMELDIRTTKDGYLVILHDDLLTRTTNGGARSVRDLTLAELKQLDAGAWFLPAFAGTRVPTLEEVFVMIKERRHSPLLLALEIKDISEDGERQLVALVQKYGLLDQSYAFSKSEECLRRLKTLNAKFRVGQNVSRDSLEQRVKAGLLDVFMVTFPPTAEQVNRLHQLGKRVVCNFGGEAKSRRDPKLWSAVREAGIDGMISDFTFECQRHWYEEITAKPGSSDRPASGSPAANEKKAPDALTFRVQQLHLDNNEGCAVADFDRDGNLDVSAGEYWYPGPRFTDQRRLRRLEPQAPDYLTNNGEHAYDVDGDGWIDVISGSFLDTRIHWYRNPGADGLKQGIEWEKRLLIETKLSKNEWSDFRDLDGDGVPEYIVNSWSPTNAVMAYRLVRNERNEPAMRPWIIHPGGPWANGHGIGFGDLNGDGGEDILYGNGWYERPGRDAINTPWIPHRDWTFPHASTPMLVVDLNGDGRNDIIWAHGHNYGLYWEERRDDNKDGSTNWRRHTIDVRVSQAHCLVWEDLDNDGRPELITGRRVRAHSGNDPGDNEPGCVLYYKWNRSNLSFTRYVAADNGPGIGLQIRVADLDRNGWKDIIVAGKSGTRVLWNEGR